MAMNTNTLLILVVVVGAVVVLSRKSTPPSTTTIIKERELSTGEKIGSVGEDLYNKIFG